MTPPPRAACLTPPAIGGIAVVQVVGEGAIPLVNACLRKGRQPVDLAQWSPRELRLCRVVDGTDTVDDAVVAVRRTDAGEPVIDLSLHGGARIVQRVLLRLQRGGAQIVEPAALLDTAWPAARLLHADANRLVLRAQTRRVAVWLAGLPDLLAAQIETIISQLTDNRPAEALAGLDALLAGAERANLLIAGVRAVLVGRPNSGKSTLANVLAEREQAIVSDLPGTTRDWTEHPAAIEGVPFTIVDTAGIRLTDDPIEAEAVRRAREQVYRARVIIRVIDRSGPPDTNEEELLPPSAGSAGDHAPILDVYNKADLPVHAGHVGGGPKAEDLRVSARTGDGIDSLRAAMLAAVGLNELNLGEPGGPPPGVPWPGDGPARQDGPRQRLVAPFTAEQKVALEQVRDILTSGRADRAAAVGRLRKLLSPAG